MTRYQYSFCLIWLRREMNVIENEIKKKNIIHINNMLIKEWFNIDWISFHSIGFQVVSSGKANPINNKNGVNQENNERTRSKFERLEWIRLNESDVDYLNDRCTFFGSDLVVIA